MHSDITKIISEFKYKNHTVKIVERSMDGLFLYFYVFDSNNRECGGINYFGFDDVTKEDLSDLSVAIPKIKSGIDYLISFHLESEKSELDKKIKMNWTGRTFKRGDFVHFKGKDKYKSVDTYVWTYFAHESIEYYLIEHPDGMNRSDFMAKPPFKHLDGFECVHSSQLQEGLKYLPIYCEEFQRETDELEIIKEVQSGDSPMPKFYINQ